MSTYWGYRCLDCDVDSDRTFSNAQGELSILALNFAAIKPLIELSIVEVKALYGSDILIFLHEHEGHDIALTKGWGDPLPLIEEQPKPTPDEESWIPQRGQPLRGFKQNP